MVGLSIVLESIKGSNMTNPQVINKTTMIKPYPSPPSPQPSHPSARWNSPSSPLPAASFLDQCFLCQQKLLPGKDIYMYKGDRAFCSVECRCRQIFMDEEESNSTCNVYKRDNCSWAAMNPKPTSSSSSATASSSSSSSRNRRGGRNRANGFAY